MNTYEKLKDMIIPYNIENNYMGCIMLLRSGFIKSMTLSELDELHKHLYRIYQKDVKLHNKLNIEIVQRYQRIMSSYNKLNK